MSATPITVPANGLLFTGLEWGPPEGPAVLLLHGFPQHCTSWAAVASRLAEAGIHSIALDQRGYSPGARPPDVASYALRHAVADAVAMIDWLGGTLHLAGHDWGGVVGWQVAARYPSRLLSWTAVSTPEPSALHEAIANDATQRDQFGYMHGLRAPDAEVALLADDGARLRAFYDGRVVDEDETVAFFHQPGALTGALNWYRAMSRADAEPLGPVTVPTSYVWGSADLAFGRGAAEATGRFVNAAYQFVPLDGATHWLLDEAPDTVAAVIAERVLDG